MHLLPFCGDHFGLVDWAPSSKNQGSSRGQTDQRPRNDRPRMVGETGEGWWPPSVLAMSVRNKKSLVQFWILRFFLQTTGWRSEPFAKTGGTGQFLPRFFVSTSADPARFCKSLEKCWPCPWESVCQQTSKCAQLVTKFFRFSRVSRSPHSTWSFTTVSCLGRGCARAAAAMMSKGAMATGGPHHHMAQKMPVDSLASVVVVGWRWGRWRMLQPAPHRQTAAGCWRMLPLAPPLPDGVWDSTGI